MFVEVFRMMPLVMKKRSITESPKMLPFLASFSFEREHGFGVGFFLVLWNQETEKKFQRGESGEKAAGVLRERNL